MRVLYYLQKLLSLYEKYNFLKYFFEITHIFLL